VIFALKKDYQKDTLCETFVTFVPLWVKTLYEAVKNGAFQIVASHSA
jgi:hypothetical protein